MMTFSGHLEIDQCVSKSPSLSTLISSGFSEFTQTTIQGLLSIPLIIKTVQIVAPFTSYILNQLSSWIPIRQIWKKMMQRKKRRQSKPTVVQRVMKWRVFRLSLYVIERLLAVIERTISPLHGKQSPTPSVEFHDNTCLPEEFGALPKLLKVRFLSSSSNTRTPNNRHVTEDNSTPLSVSSFNESVFDRSCASLIDDLSHSINVPIVDGLRQKMASKIQKWRHYIRNLDQSDEFPSWSPQCANQSDQTSPWMVHIWRPVLNWLNLPTANNEACKPPDSAQRKRKRPEGDEEDVALFITFHKGHQSLNISKTISEQANNHDQSKMGITEESSDVHVFEEESTKQKDRDECEVHKPIVMPELKADNHNKSEGLESKNELELHYKDELILEVNQSVETETKLESDKELKSELIGGEQSDNGSETEVLSCSAAESSNQPTDVCGRTEKETESDYESQPEYDSDGEPSKPEIEFESHKENQESTKQDDDSLSPTTHSSGEADNNSDYSE